MKSLALSQMIIKIGNGKEASPFYDNWLHGNEGTLAGQFSDIQIPSYIQHWKLSDISNNGI